ncbi:MAG: PQQ-binding-like beta-propeller repeat protein [Alphaproteobacteria bacterium]|nr:PQQ-binding-like beta-propeller repeat protein [Alphaproteobacteria bacterium]
MLRRTCIAATLAVTMSGCSGADLGGLLGSDQKPLAGQREAINTEGGVLAPDPELLAQPNPIPAARANASWPQAGGNSTHALGNLSASRQPKLAWSIDAGTGSSDEGRLTAQPVVANGRIYVLDTESRVSAFSTARGQKVWSVSLKPKDEEAGGGVGGGLAIVGGRLYVTTTFGELASLDAARGSVLWRKRLEVPVRASPTVSGGKIFVAGVNNEVQALSTGDGSSLWKYQGVGEQAARAASTSAAVSGNTVVVPLTTGEILAFDTSSGLSNWGDALSGSSRFSGASVLTDIAGRPVIQDGRVYAIAHAGSMGAFDLRSGEILWNLAVSGTETPWVAGDYLYTVVNKNVLAAISKTKGRPRWSYRLSERGSWAGPVMGNGLLIAASGEGSLVFVSAETGRPANTLTLGEPTFISPLIAGNTIFVLTDEATLKAFR